MRTILERFDPSAVVVLSRDELKQSEMRAAIPDERLRFFIGDVRDRDRLYRAFDRVEVVIHAAAMKQVPAAEYNPFEAIKTNILGGQNVIDAAIDRGVSHVIALSTDKAANPVNLYGATKLCSDKLFIAANAYASSTRTRLSVVRYGNVVGSRGSVIPLFLKKRHEGELPITDPRMTRFWITLQQGVDFVLDCLGDMEGGELFVPKIPSMRMKDLAEAIAPGVPTRTIGIRAGEKLHEVMVTEDDARLTVELPDRYVILPQESWRDTSSWRAKGRQCPDGFRFASDTNAQWVTPAQLATMIAELERGEG